MLLGIRHVVCHTIALGSGLCTKFLVSKGVTELKID